MSEELKPCPACGASVRLVGGNDRNTSTPFDISIKNGTCFCQIGWGTKRQDITHIAANSPDVVIATIDELLRLREENARLREALAEAADYIGDESCGSAEFWRKYRVALEAARRAVEEV